MESYKNCQSCGMPFKNDPKGGGTNADGTKNNMYCSYCFENGEFTQPNITVDEMKALVQEKTQEMGFPKFIAWFFTLGLPRLERWSADK